MCAPVDVHIHQHTHLACMCVCVPASPSPTNSTNMGDTVKLLCNAGESSSFPPTHICLSFSLPISASLIFPTPLLPLCLFYFLPGTFAVASTITATSSCLLTVSSSNKKRGRRRKDSSCMPVTMGENCHIDRRGDSEMKGDRLGGNAR